MELSGDEIKEKYAKPSLRCTLNTLYHKILNELVFHLDTT